MTVKKAILLLIIPPILLLFVGAFLLFSEPCAIHAADPEAYPEVWTPDNSGQIRCKQFQKCAETESTMICWWRSLF